MREDPALRAPWGGIFEPWRPFVLIALAAEHVPAVFRAKRIQRRERRLRVLPGQMALAFERAEFSIEESGTSSPTTALRPITAEDPITDDDVPF